MLEDLTILVPTYWSNQMFLNCIHSVMSTNPGIKVLGYKNDIGWLNACNEMMASVTTDVVLLNDDTVVLSDIQGAIRKVLQHVPDAGIIGGKALSIDQETIINYGIHIAPDGNTAHKFYGSPRNSVQMMAQQAVEGSLMWISRKVINAIGYMDQRYTMGYRAEVDYCFRAIEAGYKVVSTPDIEYIHFVSQTSGPLGIANDTYDVFMEQWGKKLRLGSIR